MNRPLAWSALVLACAALLAGCGHIAGDLLQQTTIARAEGLQAFAAGARRQGVNAAADGRDRRLHRLRSADHHRRNEDHGGDGPDTCCSHGWETGRH